ncbi:MAG: hypothetical protein ABR865_00225 [Terracidiphilus sp.]|jgi:hypothetical protein
MRSNLCTAVFLSLLGIMAISAQMPAQNQPQPAAVGSMDGMDMSKPASNGSANNASSGKPMDMNHGDSMNMGDCKMDMGKGSDAGKPMDMSHCMAMMHGAMDKSDVASIPPGVLRFTFADKSTDWTLAKLAPLAHVNAILPNEHTKANDTYSGVPLMDLLTPLGVPAGPHGAAMRIYLVAEGSDGYKAVYSLAEVNPALQDSTVIVADSENGKPLTSDGPLKLVDTRDKHPARWVRNLVAIKVLPAE